MDAEATTLQVIGGLIELAGLTVSVVALAFTWSTHASGLNFWVAARRDFGDIWRWVRRKPSGTQVVLGGKATGLAVAHGMTAITDFPPHITVEQKVDWLKTELDRTKRTAGEAKSLASATDTRLRYELNHVRSETAELRASAKADSRNSALGGLPVAGLGLISAIAGVLLQTIGSILS